MALTFPRDLVLEAYLGRWVPVLVMRQVEPVEVTWGFPNEQAKALAPPSVATAVLNNSGGHWTPGNPMSDYYAYLQGRNVPTRLSLRVIRDTFSRTVAGAWGTLDTGETWQPVTAGGGTFAVGSGVGTHTNPSAGGWVASLLPDSYPDMCVAVDGAWNLNVAGGAYEPLNLVLRYQRSGALVDRHYILRASVSTAEVLTLAIHDSVAGLISSSTVTIGSVLVPGANAFRAKFQVEGQTLRGKIYPISGIPDDLDRWEPLDWQVSTHSDVLTGGVAGVRTGVGAGNTNIPITTSYDNFTVSLLQHTGELTNLRPQWNENHAVKTAAIKMADITQRLGRPQRPALSSAPRRYLAEGLNSDFVPTDFWPLDEAASAPLQGLSQVTGGSRAMFVRETGVVPNRGAITWGETDTRNPAVPGFPTLSNGGRLVFPVQTGPLGSVSSVMWSMRLSPDAGAQVFFSTTAVSNRFSLFLYTDGTFDLFSNPSGSTVASGRVIDSGLDGRWVTMGVSFFPNGAETDCFVVVDGEINGGGFIVADAAYSPLREVLVHVPQPISGGQGGGAFSTMTVTASRWDALSSGFWLYERMHLAMMGWRGEFAGVRAQRLCSEEGVPFDYWGSLTQTRAMGPQRPEPLIDQLEECADVDGALLFAPRYTAGVAYRPRRAMTSRTADSTLDYSAKHIAPSLAPSADDRPTANLVVAEKINGGTLTVEQTAGPMNTANPGFDPDAVGISPAEAKVNCDSEAQLGDIGGWVRAQGTVPEVRFPSVTVNLRAPALTTGVDPTLPARQVTALRPGDRLVVTSLTAADVYRDLDQLVRGGVTSFTDKFNHMVRLNTSPYEKYKAGVYGDTESRYDGGITTLDAQLTAGVTGARNISVITGEMWTNAAGAYPLNVLISGELCTVSGVTGVGTAQVMTISARALNGVSKTHPAGTRVQLASPVYYC